MEYYKINKNLESLLEDYNSSIRLLSTYLEENNRLPVIEHGTTVEQITETVTTINNTEAMKLNSNFTFYVCAKKITTVQEACNHRCNVHCDEIYKKWRRCKIKIEEIVDVINTMKGGINNIHLECSVDNIGQLVSISNSFNGINYERISLEKVDEIYKRTIKDCYDKSLGRIVSFYKVFILVIIAVLLILCFTGCCQNDNNDNRISIRSEKANCTISLCQTLDTIIEGNAIISYNGRDTITIRLLCFDNSTLKLDTTFELSDKREFLIPDTTRQQMVVIPKSNVCTFNTKIVRTGFSSAEHLYKCIKICLILIALVLIVLITKPLFIKLIDNRNTMDEKILNDRLRIQNDWQDILQANYRLYIKREEMNINLQEKRQRAEIDENENRANHDRNMERTRSEQDLERYRIYMKLQTDYDQRTLININNVNEQLSQIINSLISNQ